MEGRVLDTNFNTVGVVDSFESFIWTERYRSFGDFEIYMTINQELVDLFKEDYYIWLKGSEYLMIIEESVISADIEEGSRLIIRGRSLESILERRIVWKQTTFKENANLQTSIKKVITDNIINAAGDRKILNFIFEDSTDTRVTDKKLEDGLQLFGDDVYSVVESLCNEANVGFKVTLNDSNQFVFKLYVGEDRSYNQDALPQVVFSPGYENIVNSNFLQSKKPFKNVALVAGEGEGSSQKTATVGTGSGLERRELFVQATGISSTTYADDGETQDTISNAEYTKLLQQEGKEELKKAKRIESFEGEVEASQTFILGRDFFLGDVVQLINEYNVEGTSRISEIVRSHDQEGEKTVPTFTSTEGEEDEE